MPPLNLRSDDINTDAPKPPTQAARAFTVLGQPIIFDGTSSPVKKALFIIICAAWILPGLIGHDPWKPDEAIAFGIIHSMLKEGHWLLLMIAGEPTFDYPPLYYWVGAAFSFVFSPVLPAHDGARLATGFFMALALTYLYKTATRLFDERAGRIAVLLMMGCLGLLVRGHQMNPEVAALAGISVAIYGMTRIRSEPRKGGVTTGIGAAIVALSVGIVPALAVPAVAVALMTFVGEWRNRDFRRGILISLGVMLPLMMVLPILLMLHGNINPRLWTDAILGAPFLSHDTRGSIQPFYFLQILPWFALPALPFALWLWVRDRKKLRERIELALPLVAFITLLITLSLTREAGEARALAMLMPLALAAAMALDRLPNEVARIMDWFGLVFFGIVAVALWFYYAVALTQFPERAAASFARQVPDFTLPFNVFAFVLAVALTLVWLYAVIRAHRNNRRAVVNWAAGITLVWVLANLLGQPAVNHVLSHRKVVTTIASIIPNNATCVASFGLGDSERASFDTFANLRFVRQFADKSGPCNWLLTQGSRERAPVVDAIWQMVWEGARPRDKDERFRLYRRQQTTQLQRGDVPTTQQ